MDGLFGDGLVDVLCCGGDSWQRVMVGQQILCTSVGPAWKHCLLVIGCLFLHSDWMMCLLPIHL